jgi:hypothetical protein
MPEHVFREVHPDEFEQHIQRAAQTNLDQVRDYAGKKTYLNQDNTVGYALRNDGYWGNLFSFAKGGGAAAARDAIARGALWGTAFDRQGPKNLIEHYKAFGLRPFAREKNWEEGGPDMVYVKFDHAPIPEEVKHKIEQGIARPESEMVKMERRTIFSILRGTPHPHSYEWHDGHSIHHKTIMKADEDAGKSFEHATNEQVATVGVPTYAEYAKHYGTIDKGVQSHDSAYNYKGLSDKINDLIKQHGYQVYYAGGKYGKPDLATKNYDTNHLMIYDPTPDSGGDQGDLEQTDNWRKVHELAHALTREQVNNTRIPGFGVATYGERPRMGRLGKQRTLRDAMRAIHWEALAVQKQRELSEQLGLKVSQEDFNREWNTNQHDATHRAVTGRFSEPRKEGFHPSTTPVPIEFSLGLARKAAEQMGIKGLDELKGMVKSELLVKTERLLTQLRKATSTRTGHITFPQLGATTHEKPMIIKPSQVAGKIRMSSVGDVSSLTPWGKKKEIKNIRQEASDIQRDAEEDVQGGHVMGMMASAPWIPHNTIINRIRERMGKPTTGGSRSTGFATGPSSIGSVESGRRLNAVEAHEEQHSVGGRLHYIHPAASKAAFDRVGWMAVSQDQNHPNHYPMVVDAINRHVQNVGLDPRVSPYEELFAYGQQYLMDPKKRDFFHNQVEQYNGGKKMSIIDKRNAFKTIERIMNLGKQHAANMTQDDLVEQLRSMGHKV